MPVLTGGFESVYDASSEWSSTTELLYTVNDLRAVAYCGFYVSGSVAYVRLYNWQYRNTIPDGSTINSVLFKIDDAYYTDYTGRLGVNLENTDDATNRKLSDYLNTYINRANEYIPTSGTGESPSWWVTGWTSEDIITLSRNTSVTNALRFYGVSHNLAPSKLSCETVRMIIDYTEPSSGGSVMLGSFG